MQHLASRERAFTEFSSFVTCKPVTNDENCANEAEHEETSSIQPVLCGRLNFTRSWPNYRVRDMSENRRGKVESGICGKRLYIFNLSKGGP